MSNYYAIVLFVLFVVNVSSQHATICDESRLYTFVPDVRDCSAWFYCGNQGPVRGLCSNPFVFNPITKLCDWPHNVDCFQCPSNVGLHQIPINGSCRSFIRCINGISSQKMCEIGLQFNEITGQCDLTQNVRCQTGFRCPDELPSDGTIIAIRDNYNCSVYHVCVGHSEAVRQECNPELHFDPLTILCTYPNMTDCPIIQYPDGPGSGPGSPEQEYKTVTEYQTQLSTDTQTGLLSDSPNESPTLSPPELPPASLTASTTELPPASLTASTTESQTETPTASPTPEFECMFDGIHPHPTECDEYYICTGNMPHPQLMRCAKGLHFNVAILHCDTPENANCDFYNTIA